VPGRRPAAFLRHAGRSAVLTLSRTRTRICRRRHGTHLPRAGSPSFPGRGPVCAQCGIWDRYVALERPDPAPWVCRELSGGGRKALGQPCASFLTTAKREAKGRGGGASFGNKKRATLALKRRPQPGAAAASSPPRSGNSCASHH